jgi:hypothetical protein
MGDVSQKGIGHKWEGPIPSRQVRLVSLIDDLYDTNQRKYVAEEFGPTAFNEIAKWRQIVSANSTIFLSSQGRGVAYMNGDLIYIGSLIDESDAELGEISGFFKHHSYVLRINGDIEDRATGDILRDISPEAARDIGYELLMQRPTGGPLRITTDGLVASRVKGSWIPLTKVTSQDWFPGHLA